VLFQRGAQFREVQAAIDAAELRRGLRLDGVPGGLQAVPYRSGLQPGQHLLPGHPGPASRSMRIGHSWCLKHRSLSSRPRSKFVQPVPQLDRAQRVRAVVPVPDLQRAPQAGRRTEEVTESFLDIGERLKVD
jgi:hypothetical protein